MKLTISGLPGAGKGAIGKMLSEHFNLKFLSVGQFRRNLAMSKGLTLDELNKIGETESWTDELADNYQKELNEKDEKFIFEGRLSWYFIPNSIKLFFTIDEKVAATRIFNDQRASEKKFETTEEVIAYNKERNHSDILRYQKIYNIPNCYDENNFDIVIDTTRKSVEEVFNETLLRIGEFEKN